MRLIDAYALLAEYDRQHEGEPWKARKLNEDVPAVAAAPVSELLSSATTCTKIILSQCEDCAISIC